ncbi:hypothetical protein BVH01_12485 [Pseudomonas sp. PA1(2017)]|nr:hypothetical protein BVH01_12485 [Pseudomonas sp. PA1(2017)]
MFTVSALSAELATRDAARYASMFPASGLLGNAVQHNLMWRAACHLNFAKRARCQGYPLIELLDRLPIALFVAIEITIAHTINVISTLGFDSLELGTAKSSICHQDQHALIGEHKLKRVE